jgi:hypothetical protein
LNLSVDAETSTELFDDSTELDFSTADIPVNRTNRDESMSVSGDDRYCATRKTHSESGESEIEVLRGVKRMKIDISDGLPGIKGYCLPKGWADLNFTGKTTEHGHKIYELKDGLRVIQLPSAVKNRILEESKQKLHR